MRQPCKKHIDTNYACATMRDMKRSILSLMVAGAGLLMVAGCPAAEWLSDPDAAVAQAKEESRTMLLEFTGSDWCPPCKYLRAHIFPHEAFQSFVEEQKLVLVELDFPRNAEKLTPEQRATNEAWRVRYNVTSFPSILVLDGTGAPYAVVTSANTKVEDYMVRLKAALKKKDDLQAAVKAARELSGAERAQALAAALAELPAEWRLLHREVVDDILANDQEDKAGYRRMQREIKLTAEQLKELEVLYEKYRMEVSAVSQENAIADVQKLLAREDLMPVVRLHAYKFLSDTYALGGDLQKTYENLKAAIEAAPDSKEAARLRPWLENLERNMFEKKEQ